MTLPLNLMIADTMPRKVWLTNFEVRAFVEKKYGKQKDRYAATLKNFLNSSCVRIYREGEYQTYRYMLIDFEKDYLRRNIRQCKPEDLTDWMKELVKPRVDIPAGVLIAQFNQLIAGARMR